MRGLNRGHCQAADGRLLGHRSAGPQDGAAVFFFTGTPGSRLDLEVGGVGDAAAERGMRLIVLERPGYGRSDRAPARRVVDRADDVRQAADALGVDPFAVVGYSGGGPHALACAACIPDRVTAAACVSSVGVPGIPGAFDGMGPTERLVHRLVGVSPRLVDLVYRLVRRNARRNPDRFFRDFQKDCSESDRAVLSDERTRDAVRATVLEALRAGVGGAVDDWVVLERRDWASRRSRSPFPRSSSSATPTASCPSRRAAISRAASRMPRSSRSVTKATS
jgi:pimeloyl-ACP methyl ester carboxylesterase